MTNGSSFIASSAQPFVTPYEMKAADERFARAVITAHVGKDMLETSAQLAERVAEQQVSVAAESYLRSRNTALESISNLIGVGQSDLIRSFRKAAETGQRTRINARYGIELSTERLVLIHFPS